MPAREAVIVTERREDAPTRRIVYEPRECGGYVRYEELYRLAKEGWHTVGSEYVLADVVVSR